ncbi:DUF2169 domain-containing protein [Sorangium sp. So ce1153]|uniref:DUF2169 family type VI secretion system accessory protein n=1 Tax=Sorangium sp. So ce1153 TaxID=3133333 RepID=UPI003F62CAB8
MSSLLWQPRPGAHALTVVCKATFELRPGSSPLAVEQEAPWESDIHRDDDPGRSLCAASDLAPFKRRADVLVLGHARPPRGSQPATLVARIAVGTLDKAIEVRADRGWAALGLGPIARTWPARTEMLRRHAPTWDHHAWNSRPLPEDVDGAFFNDAPVDQQITELTGDEWIVLEHLHPRHTRIETRLARVSPSASVQRENAAPQDVRLRCDTLTIDADRGLAMLVWRGVVVLSHPAEQGVVAVTAQGVEIAGAQGATAEVPPRERPSASPGEDHEDGTGTVWLQADAAARPALPFLQGGASDGAHDAEEAPTTLPRQRGDGDEPGTGTVVNWHIETATGLTPVMPFQREIQALVEPDPESIPAPDAAAAAARGPSAYAPLGIPPPAMLPRIAPWPEGERSPVHVTPVVEKPGSIGSPARAPTAVLEETPPEAGRPPAEGELPAAQQEPAPANVELTVEQCATIAAEIAEGSVARAKVLELHGLDERIWRANEARWNEAIKEERAKGRQVLRGAYDAAYVARVEGFRGEIMLEEYARIVVGIERGKARAALDELRIQREALMPIVRLWTKRAATDMRMADRAAGALRGARRT